ncbi:hypothetical protein BH09VER1_BH09VER1_29740 [soil metagenome]
MDATLDLFAPEPPALAAKLKSIADKLREQNVFIGTSSWKYPGWNGQLYAAERYSTRGKFAQTRFDDDCLEEYAQTFHTVCVDAGFYRFPSPKTVNRMADQVPETFRFSWKVTDEITVRRFPALPRHGVRAGQLNENFLNAPLFIEAFLGSMSEQRAKTGTLIFEFSRFHAKDFEHGRDFVDALDNFLGQLPTDWQYAVELRNKGFLQAEYFEVLRKHRVAHTFNSWTHAPPVVDQLSMPGSDTTDFMAGRFLLQPGRGYEVAVEMFKPYEGIKEPYEVGRTGLRQLVVKASGKKRPSYIYVNNRLEGNALQTILAVLASLDAISMPSGLASSIASASLSDEAQTANLDP